MSRIEEALKRVAGHGTVSELSHGAERDGTPPGGSVLEHYPVEHPAPSARALRESAPRRQSRPEIQDSAVLSPRWVGPESAKLVVSPDVPALVAEQYRRLAAALHQLHVEQELKTLMVTSALPQDGKTLTVTNLALTLSESYKRKVLLIDADLRRPAVHNVFGARNSFGLTEALRPGGARPRLEDVSPRLAILTAGPAVPDPMALLTSERMRDLLKEVSSTFDWVLLDAPPVGLMPDAAVLARLTGAVLFVIGAGSTPYPLVQRAIAELGNECIVGTVLNRIEHFRQPVADYYQAYYGGSSSVSGGT